MLQMVWLKQIIVFNENFYISKMLLGHFNTLFNYTFFMLILILRNSFKKKSQLRFPCYSIYIFNVNCFKTSIRGSKYRPITSTQETLDKRLLDRSFRYLGPFTRFIIHNFQDCYITISIKIQKYSKFHQMFLSLSGDKSLSSGPTFLVLLKTS